jgi:hypothetical protein
MLESRILTAHTSNESTSERVLHKIVSVYFDEFAELQMSFERLIQQG